MHTIRLLLWKHKPTKEGLYPLVIVVTINRERTYFRTSFKLRENQWKDGAIVNYANSKLANATLRAEIAKYESEILTRQLEGEKVTAKSLKFKSSVSFSEFAKEVKGDNRANRKEIKRVVRFNHGDPSIAEINTEFLRKFEKSERVRGMSNNTINSSFKWLRRIINQALSEKKIKFDPFEGFIFPRYVQTMRTFLTIEEVNKIEKKIKEDLPAHLYLTAVYYLFGCYTGLRYSDWGRFDLQKNIQGERLILRAQKNNAIVSIKIYKRLAAVLKRMKTIDKPFSIQKMNFFLKEIGFLAGIKKKLTCHTSRHTAATLMATMGVSSDTAAELLGVNRRTIDIYYKVTGTKIDKETEVMNNL